MARCFRCNLRPVQANGSAVTTKEEWAERRAEIENLLAEHYYGTAPPDVPPLVGAKVRHVVCCVEILHGMVLILKLTAQCFVRHFSGWLEHPASIISR